MSQTGRMHGTLCIIKRMPLVRRVVEILTLCLWGTTAYADSLCADLQPTKFKGTWAVAPFTCADGTNQLCAKLLHEVMDCVKKAGNQVIAPGGLTASLDEKALREALGTADTRQ